MAYIESDPNFGTDPTPQPPPGYRYDENGNLVPITAAPSGSNTSTLGPITPTPLPPGFTSTWDPGSQAPSNAPPGMHWDANYATYVPDAPTTGGGGGTGSGGGAGAGAGLGASGTLTAPFSEVFSAPSQLNLGGPSGISYIPPTPSFTPPSYTPPPAFNLPTAADAANDPGYQFTSGQGLQALQQSAAARGLANTGGTAKDLINYGQAAAATQYNNVLNRQLQQYNTNYQSQYLDPYSIAFQNAAAAFAPQMTAYQTQAQAGQRQNELNYNNAWDQYLFDFNKFQDQRDSTFNKTFAVQTAQ